jgi:anti-repressor protein
MSNLNIQIQSQIKATVESDQEFAVNFDDAWQWLEYSRKDAAKRVLVANFEQNIDYLVSHTIVENLSGGRPTEEIYLTKSCFKELAMLSGTARGKEIRLYFLECERQLKAIQASQPKLPGNYIEALEALIVSEKEKQTLALEAAELRPKAEDWDSLCSDKNLFNVEKVAKILAIKGLGKIKLFEWLRNQGILYLDNNKRNVPYQKYVDLGYFQIKFKQNMYNGELYAVTLVTAKGFSFIKRQLIKDGYVLPPVANEAALTLPYEIAA